MHPATIAAACLGSWGEDSRIVTPSQYRKRRHAADTNGTSSAFVSQRGFVQKLFCASAIENSIEVGGEQAPVPCRACIGEGASAQEITISAVVITQTGAADLAWCRDHIVLSTDESDKLARLARITTRAEETLGDPSRGAR